MEDDEPIPNMAKFFGLNQNTVKDGNNRKKKKSEPSLNKRQKLGKIDKVKVFSRLKRKNFFRTQKIIRIKNDHCWADFYCTCITLTGFLQVPSTHTIGF